MRLMEIVIVFFATVIMGISCQEGMRVCVRLNNKAERLEKQVMEKKFVSKSFIQTCEGRCFSNLNDWQVSCRNMFNLSYIAWSKAEDFLVDEAKEIGEKETLFYGTWIDSSGTYKGEIYARGECE